MRMRGRNPEQPNVGSVVSVRGSVMDARFPQRLPALFSLLQAGDRAQIAVEVISHLNAEVVRCIALTPTRGLAMGSPVVDTGHPLRAPVGDALLGRVFNVFGEVIDRKEEITGVERRSIHGHPVPLSRQSTVSEVFETGIKTIDVLAPLERGGKAGLFGGAGVGKTVLIME
jgi:F-type H+-transporting ATPase subunit beta